MLASLPRQERSRLLASLSEAEFEQLETDWSFWARKNQLQPAGAWSVWLILAGRGFGKTRTGAETVRMWMCGPTPLARGLCRHIALVAETAADARKVMVGDGFEGTEGSGIMQVHAKDFRPTYNPSLKRLTWPNGAIASLYNATEPDELRGPQHDGAWCDELAKWRYAQETWDQLQFGMRIGAHPRTIVTTTPKPIKLLRDILSDTDTVVTTGSTYENIANLAPKFIATVVRKYEGTRLGRQELRAEILDDVPGALWTRARIEELRTKPHDVPELRRIVVAIDPSVTSGEDSNEAGVVCAGLGVNGHAYILEDLSAVMSPTEWATKAITLYRDRKADRIVGEVNNGGDMVETTIRAVDPAVPFKAVHASRGKLVRAEPVSALYEQGKVHHVGAFPVLEDQMCEFTPDMDRKAAGYSPDRLDAMVWALTELMVNGSDVVFTASERDAMCAPFAIPNHWPRVFALFVDRTRCAAIWGAFDTDADVLYLFAEYLAARTDLAVHAAAIRDRARWVPGLFDPDQNKGDGVDGQAVLDQLVALNVDLYTVESSLETGVAEAGKRFSAKRLVAFSTLTAWWDEFRRYRRNEKGEIVTAGHALMQCTGLLCTSAHFVAVTEAQTKDLDDELYAERNSSTGY